MVQNFKISKFQILNVSLVSHSVKIINKYARQSHSNNKGFPQRNDIGDSP